MTSPQQPDLAFLKARHLAECFQVPLRMIYQWVSRQGLPGEQIGDQYYFHPLQVLDWVMGKGLPLYNTLLPHADGQEHISCTSALQRGGRIAIPLDGPAGIAQQEGLLAKILVHVPPAGHLALPALQQLPRARPRLLRAEWALPSPWAPWPGPGHETSLWIFHFPHPARLPLFTAAPVTNWFWIVSPAPVDHWLLLEHLYQELSHGTRPEWVTELDFTHV